MRLALLILLLLPSAANAAPVIAILGTEVIGTITVGQILLTVGMAVYGAAQQRRAARAQRDAYNSSLQDRTITNVATETPYRYVYGRARVGSSVVAIFASGDKDQYKHIVCVHASHECDAIEEIYIAGKALGPLDGNGWVTQGDFYNPHNDYASEVLPETVGATFTLARQPVPGSLSVIVNYGSDGGSESADVTIGPDGRTITINRDYTTGFAEVVATYMWANGTPRVRVSKHLGTPGDPVDAYLNGLLPDKWPATAVLRGFCYTVVTLDLNQTEFQGGIPSIEVLLRGKKLYDPRTGSTLWSQNPALAIYDYLISDLCGVPPADIPLSSVIAAANDCDEQIVGSEVWGVPGARYTLNGVVTADQPQQDVLEKMAQAMAGGIVSTSWQMWAGKYTAPVIDLYLDKPNRDGDMVGALSITPGISDADIYNGVKGQYVSAENSYVATDFEPYQNPTYVSVDGVEKWTNIDFPFTDKKQRAWNLARIYTEDQRNGFTVKAEFSYRSWRVRVGQRVTLTSALFGWDKKVFRVTDKKFSPTSMIELTLKEDAPSIWDFVDEALPDATPNTNLPNPFQVDPLTGIACSSGTDSLLLQSDGTVVSRIHVTWNQATTQAVATNGIIEVEWQQIGTNFWTAAQVSGNATGTYASPVQDGKYYVIRVRPVNPYMNAKAAWVYINHQVIGKTAAPANVPWFSIEGNVLAWGSVPDLDLAGYHVRFQYGQNRSWSDAIPLHDGLLKQSPYEPTVLPQGPITVMIKAIDTTGNESVRAAIVQTQFGDAVIANVVESFDFHALAYPGTLTGGTPISGKLMANSTANFFSQNDASTFYGPLEGSTFFADYFSAMVYETTAFVPTNAALGSNMTLDLGMTGDLLQIEYRMSEIGPMFPALDTEPFYTRRDDENFYGMLTVYRPWPGQISAKPAEYHFRFTTGQSATRGVIDACKVIIDVPDVSERLNEIVISAAGTRLPITKHYQTILNVQLTLQDDGGTAFKPEIVDRDAVLGPLVRCRNSSNALTTGKIDAVIQGY